MLAWVTEEVYGIIAGGKSYGKQEQTIETQELTKTMYVISNVSPKLSLSPRMILWKSDRQQTCVTRQGWCLKSWLSVAKTGQQQPPFTNG